MLSQLSLQIIALLNSEARFSRDDEYCLQIDGHVLGWVKPHVAEALQALAPAQITTQVTKQVTTQLTAQAAPVIAIHTGNDPHYRSQCLQAWAQALREQGHLTNWRDELMQIHVPEPERACTAAFLADTATPFASLERAAFRTFGLCTSAVHLNGWVITADGVALWVAQRSPHKFVDPGKLDNLVGGGIAAGESIKVSLARESWEEAGLHFRHVPSPSATLRIQRRIPEGVQNELVAVHDVWLPAHFQASNQDGEVASARLLPLSEVISLLLDGHFTWDSGLVIIDGLLRQHYFGADNIHIEATLQTLGYRG